MKISPTSKKALKAVLPAWMITKLKATKRPTPVKALATIPKPKLKPTAAKGDLVSISQEMMRAGYVLNAQKCLALIPDNQRLNKEHQLLTNANIALGKYEQASKELDKICDDELTESGTWAFLRAKAQIQDGVGDIRGAISTYMTLQAVNRDKILGYAVEVLKLHQKSGNVANFQRYAKLLMNSYPHHTTVIEIYAAYLYDNNQLDELELFLVYHLPRLRSSTKLCILEATCAWMNQDIPRFDRTMAIIRDAKLCGRVSAEQIQRWRRHIPSAEVTAQAMIELAHSNLETVRDGPRVNMAWTLYMLDEHDAALQVLDDYIAGGGTLIQAYLVRGLILHALGKSTLSLKDLSHVMEHAPRQMLAYRAALQMSFEKYPDMSDALDLVAHRNRNNPQFTRLGGDGRLGFYDVEFGQSLWFQGKYLEGYRAKLNKATCAYIEQKFPQQYRSFAEYGLTAKDKRVLILADDGISDEIRWASVYAELPKNCDILITCEPRLQSLFERSFPKLEFTPVMRRWPDLPREAPPNRTEIDNVDFGRIITDELFHDIPNYDRLMFQQDLIAANWEQQPNKNPSINGPGHGSFLKPDPALLASWKKKLGQQAKQSKNRLKVGLNWRSGLVNARRQKQYLFLFELLDILQIENIDFYALQHGMSDAECDLCEEYGIILLDGVDWHDDFETIAAVCACLDLVVGISSSSFEIAAAVGTPCWLPGISPESVGLRLGDSPLDIDRLSWNTRVIRPPEVMPEEEQEKWPRKAVLTRLHADLITWASTRALPS